MAVSASRTEKHLRDRPSRGEQRCTPRRSGSHPLGDRYAGFWDFQQRGGRIPGQQAKVTAGNRGRPGGAPHTYSGGPRHRVSVSDSRSAERLAAGSIRIIGRGISVQPRQGVQVAFGWADGRGGARRRPASARSHSPHHPSRRRPVSAGGRGRRESGLSAALDPGGGRRGRRAGSKPTPALQPGITVRA